MIRRPPKSTLDRSSAASDVYKRQRLTLITVAWLVYAAYFMLRGAIEDPHKRARYAAVYAIISFVTIIPVSYTHLRAHETVLDLVCRLLLAKKHNNTTHITVTLCTYTHTHTQ